jgi:hypothetical protein
MSITADISALNLILLPDDYSGIAIYFARVCHLHEQSGKKLSDESISEHGAYSHTCLRCASADYLFKNGFSEKR